MSTNYAASSALTISLASLAASATFVAGRESTAVDNSSNKYDDYLLAGVIKAGTSPTAGEVRVYVAGMLNDTVWPDVLTGSDSAKTITSATILDALGKLCARMVNDTTTGRVYPFGPISVAALFGGVVPRKFEVFIAHSMVAALDATGGNHVISITPVTLT